jgi:tRNA modification GTPase
MLQGVIAAISTPPGKGGVAVIRMSGEGAVSIAEKVFFPRSQRAIRSYPPRHQIYGDVKYNGEQLDDGMLCYFSAPNSYTGEEIVEISVHGGLLITRKVLETLLISGAKMASAGEFTRRAFINGKLSLTEAEAIGSLLEAKSEEQIRLASSAAREKLNASIDKIRVDMRDLLSSMYARIDYPDEDLGDFSDEECIIRLGRLKCEIARLISSYKTGRAINEGINTVICGKPNVGKSSVYNMVFRDDLAIVTDVEGTTRDVLTGQVPLGRVLLNLSDTAGIRDAELCDTVEQIGIERAEKRIEASELLICVFDYSRVLSNDDQKIIDMKSSTDAAAIALINKCDLTKRLDTKIIEDSFDNVIYVSIKADESDALTQLCDTVEKLFTDEKIKGGEDAIISTARQNARLVRASEFIESAISAFRLGLSQDASSSDIERALGEIAELDGRAVSEEVVSDIFSKFCVGK